MVELATAWVTLAVSADGMQSSVRRELNKLDGAMVPVGRKMGRDLEAGVGGGASGAARQVEQRLSAQLGAQVGSTVGRAIGGGINASITAATKVGEAALKVGMVGAAGVAAAAVGGVGLALTKGFDRLKSIDQAKFKLQALGNDSAAVAKIMDSALASVKGTAFGMDDAVTAAASAVAAGIKPGQELTKYLKEVGDASAIAGTSFSDMGSIFNKIQTSNKAYTDDLQQLSDRGLPIFQWLQKEYGVTGDALTKMVQNGEVDAAHFQAAIANNIGGAALKMGQSFEGSVQNMQAALGRLGAAFLAPIFGNAAGGIGGITDGLDKMTAWVQAHQPEILTFFTNIGVAAITFAQDVVRSFGNVMQGIGQFTHALGTAVSLFDSERGAELQNAGDKINGIGDALVNSLGKFDAAKDRVRGWGAAAVEAAANAQNAVGGAVKGIGTQVGALPFKKVIQISADTSDAESKLGTIGNSVAKLPFKKTIEIEMHETKGNPSPNGSPNGILPPVLSDGPLSPDFIPPQNPIRMVPRRATGGPVFGAGTATSDSIPAWLSNGEFVVNADATRKNMPLLSIINSGKIPGFAGGGQVGLPNGPGDFVVSPDNVMTAVQFAQSVSGSKYSYGSAGPTMFDCSGFMSAIYGIVTGKSMPSGQRYFTTESDFSKLGFLPGYDANSAFNIGVHNGGGGKNSHMAGTLLGQNVESGGASGTTKIGESAAGALDPQFEKKYHLAGSTLTQAFANSMGDGAQSEADKLAESSKGGSSGGSRGGGFDASSLGQSLVGGIMQSVGLDGSVFSDPTQWPNFKSGMALANYGLSFLNGGSGGASADGGMNIAGLNMPSLSGLLNPAGPQAMSPVDPNTATHGQAGGAAPGPVITYNMSGVDPKTGLRKADTHANENYRRSGLPAVRP